MRGGDAYTQKYQCIGGIRLLAGLPKSYRAGGWCRRVRYALDVQVFVRQHCCSSGYVLGILGPLCISHVVEHALVAPDTVALVCELPALLSLLFLIRWFPLAAGHLPLRTPGLIA